VTYVFGDSRSAKGFRVSPVIRLLFIVLLVATTPLLAQQDTTPPTLVSFDFSPTQVDTTSAPANVTVTFHVTDDLSGYSYGDIHFQSPSGQVIATSLLYRVSGTAQDGVYQGTLTVAAFSEPGTWTVIGVALEDAVNNFVTYSAAQLQSLGHTTLKYGPTPVASINPLTLPFGDEVIGTSSPGQSLTISSTGQATLSITGLTLNAANTQEFTISPTPLIPIAVKSGQSTTLNIFFKPQSTGNRTAQLVFTDDASDSPQVVTLSGNGVLASTTTSLTSSANPTFSSQAVTFAASISSSGPGTPTGTMEFKDGMQTLASVTLSSTGQATYTTVALAIGSHSISAFYSGDANFSGSTSSVLTQNVNQAGSTISLGSSTSAAVYSQPITFTTVVTVQNGGAATGTVTFKDGSTPLGNVPLSGNTARITLNALAIGSHFITAVYSGDGNVTGSSSAALTETVSKAATTLVVASSANPATIGSAVTFTITVLPQFSDTPTGTVVLKNGGSVLGALALNGGQASYTKTFSGGTFSITPVYGGDAHFNSSTSPVLKQVVNKIATSTAVTSSSNPITVGQQVTFTATISSGAGAPPDGEIVSFKDGSTTLGTGPLSGGGASFTTSALAAGTRSITATYSGDTRFSPSASPKFNQTVNRYGTVATVTSSGSPSNFGQSVTFLATFSSPSGQAISGTLTFKNGGAILGTQTLTGSNTITVSTLTVGTHAITVVYNGDTINAPSTSPAISQVVTKAATSTNIMSSPNPSTVGQAVTFTATVGSSTSGTPTGTVTFKSGTALLGTLALSSGSASVSTSSLGSGSHTITATYSGSGSFTTSSTTLTQAVN
jgi:hypothetical protein